MTDLTSLKVLLFDTGGVLYHRPREDAHLRTFLEMHSLALRPRSVLEKGLRAALFDAHTGRISRDTLYDAILRLNGIKDHQNLFPEGRSAIYQDTVDIELFPGVVETLTLLRSLGMRLGTISDTVYSAREKIAWLAARGVAPETWDTFVVSSEVGMTKVYPELFQHALDQLGVPPDAAGFVGHATSELEVAHEAGLTTVAFLPDNYAIDTDYIVGSFFQLAEMANPLV